jgi:hypothetical protein
VNAEVKIHIFYTLHQTVLTFTIQPHSFRKETNGTPSTQETGRNVMKTEYTLSLEGTETEYTLFLEEPKPATIYVTD